MKKALSLLLVLTMIFSVFMSVSVSAEEATIARISLSKNTSFYTSAVSAGTKLIVTAFDADGNEVSLEGKTIAYESSRPWVFDIGADGTITDYGYDGTTIVTATVDGVSGSLVMIKSTTSTTITSGFETDITSAGGCTSGTEYAYYGYRDGAPTYGTDNTIVRVDGEKYIQKGGQLVYRGSWDNAAGIRIAQGWFYDDLENDVQINLSLGIPNPRVTYYTDYVVGGENTLLKELGVYEHYIPYWAEIGLDESIHNAVIAAGTSEDNKAVRRNQGYYIHAAIGGSNAVSGSFQKDASKYYFSDNRYESDVTRTKGWHQATVIIDENAGVKLYLDGVQINQKQGGECLMKSHNSLGQAATYLTGNNFDDLAFATNANIEKPDDFYLPASRISLSGNETFITSVDETASLVVTALDKNGEETDLPAGEITYTSTRPWVLSVGEDGKFIDGGFEGTTTVTATIGDMSASTIFIKGNGGGYNISDKLDMNVNGYSGSERIGDLQLRARTTWSTGANASYVAGNASDVAARIPGKAYINKTATSDKTVAVGDYTVNFGVDETSWYKAGIRVGQGWFYDDGTSDVRLGWTLVEHANNLDAEFKQHIANTSKDHLYWVGHLVSGAGASTYGAEYFTAVANESLNTVARTKGWHQATAIMNNDATVDIFVDGQLLAKSTIAHRHNVSNFFVSGFTKGNYDDFVVAQNANTTKPAGYITPAVRLSLNRNNSYFTEVDETASLIVTGYDADGDETLLPEGTEITYESSRPWVIDIAEDGKFVDGGYNGSTIVTATANGMSASLILIKTDGDGPGSFNRTLFVHADDVTYGNNDHAFTKADGSATSGYIYRRSYNNDYNASTGKFTSVVANDGDRDFDGDSATNNGLYGNLTIGGGNVDWSITIDYRSLSWDVQGGLRIRQFWFYDDGTTPLNVDLMTYQKLGAMNDLGHGVISAWQGKDTGVGYGWDGNLKSNETVYTTTAPYETMNTINRTVGWHQATNIIEEDGTIVQYIDGEELFTAKLTPAEFVSNFRVNPNSVGKYDDFVVCSNPNTEKPMTITASADANGTVSPASVDTHVGEKVQFTVTPNEGYLIDTITYNGQSLTATDNKVTVTAVDGAETLAVTFKASTKAPAIGKTAVINADSSYNGAPAAITFLAIDEGSAGTVKEAGILLGFEGVANTLKLIGYADNEGKIPLTAGSFAIKVYGDILHGVQCTSTPFVTYTDAEGEKTGYGDAETFTINN